MGRPKKENAIKAGELRKGLKRFSFIVEEKYINELKGIRKLKNLTMKGLMNEVISSYLAKDRERKLNNITPTNENEKLLLNFLKKNT